MTPIPTKLREALDLLNTTARRDRQAALSRLNQLGIAPDTQFSAFYLAYQGPFSSPCPVEELLDIDVPSAEIADQTEYVHDAFEIPENLICLTTTESEGFFLYDKTTEAVYDVDFKDIDSLLSGNLKPKWESFNDFLVWYFSGL